MLLTELLRAAGVEADVRGEGDPGIEGLAYDSRAVEAGTLFFCVRGFKSDGHEFAPQAVEDGAAALVVERPLELGVPEVQVEDARAAMAPLAAAFFGDPTASMTVVGITGTNGKTTTAFLVREILEALGSRCGLLGTVQRVVGGEVEEVERTTPEAIDLQATFNRMRDAGDAACVMEVSSHALVLHRADAIRFDAKAFTNLTQDHLDFHSDMDDYFAAKRLLFTGSDETGVREGGVAVVNVDDDYGRRLADELGAGDAEARAVVTFSASGAEADLVATDVRFDAAGASFTCRTPDGALKVRTGLPGQFNVENALAALAIALGLGMDVRAAADALAGAARVPGRFEPIDEGQEFAVLVDYAHTPEALANVLRAARELTEGRLIAVFGAGGDRDSAKRPLMGREAAELSDVPVVTSDNPRSEEPQAIVDQILGGMDGDPVVEVDRRKAIALALERAEPGDVVVIAGKGHEQGQEFEEGRKVPFDDRDVAREELRRLRDAT